MNLFMHTATKHFVAAGQQFGATFSSTIFSSSRSLDPILRRSMPGSTTTALECSLLRSRVEVNPFSSKTDTTSAAWSAGSFHEATVTVSRGESGGDATAVCGWLSSIVCAWYALDLCMRGPLEQWYRIGEHTTL
jgi:hypothetical protein